MEAERSHMASNQSSVSLYFSSISKHHTSWRSYQTAPPSSSTSLTMSCQAIPDLWGAMAVPTVFPSMPRIWCPFLAASSICRFRSASTAKSITRCSNLRRFLEVTCVMSMASVVRSRPTTSHASAYSRRTHSNWITAGAPSLSEFRGACEVFCGRAIELGLLWPTLPNRNPPRLPVHSTLSHGKTAYQGVLLYQTSGVCFYHVTV